LSQSKGEIRVMTVHGAKGLEAPVVILPDTGPVQGGRPGVRLARDGDGPVFWPMSRAEAAAPVLAALEAAERRERAERNRLLYVALTRAESWLIVAAAGKLTEDADKRAATWYGAVEDGLRGLGARPLSIPGLDGEGMRLQSGEFPEHGTPPTEHVPTREDVRLPEWAKERARPVPRDTPTISPSDLGGDKVLLADRADTGAEPGGDALRRGRLVHLMLEHLPNVPPPAWRETAPRIAALEARDVTDAELADIYREAEAVLTAPRLAHVFGPDTLAEVPLHGESRILGGPVLGAIDRLIVEDARVLAVDFKTNALVPDRPEDVPEGLLRQMGAYAEMLRAIYPDRAVATAILWSRTATLMELPEALVADALRRAAS
jgi:ATP-dependent helicase/nuclease subunit A